MAMAMERWRDPTEENIENQESLRIKVTVDTREALALESHTLSQRPVYLSVPLRIG